MPKPSITYTISGKTYAASDRTEGLNTVAIVPKLESNQLFYRLFWDGEITFVGADFKRLWELAKTTCCQEILVNLYRNGSGCNAGTLYWHGNFNLSQIEFNISTGKARLTEVPKPIDGYDILQQNWTREINWMEMPVTVQEFTDAEGRKHNRGRDFHHFLSWMIFTTLKDTPGASMQPLETTVGTLFTAKINPVTRRANYLIDLVLLQASDYCAPLTIADNKLSAMKAKVTLRAIIEDLIALFCAYPHIDPNLGTIRWEHESYYPQLGYTAPVDGIVLPENHPVWNRGKIIRTDTSTLFGIRNLNIEPNRTLAGDDFTFGQRPVVDPTLPDQPRKPVTQGPRSGQLPQENGGLDETTNIPGTDPDFANGSIEFTDACVTRGDNEDPLTQDRSVRVFCTDTYAARKQPGRVDKANWIMLINLFPITLFNQNRKRGIAGALVEKTRRESENGLLAASNLIRDFHRHNAPFGMGIMNKDANWLPQGVKRGMLSVYPNRLIEGITIPFCCTDGGLDFRKTVETWYGTGGYLRDMKYDLTKEELTFSVAHVGPCQIAPDETEYDPDGPLTDCPARGKPIRSLTRKNAAGRLEYVQILADGNCGEYEQVSVPRQNTRGSN